MRSLGNPSWGIAVRLSTRVVNAARTKESLPTRVASSVAVAAACLAASAATASATGAHDDLVSGTGQGIFWTQFGSLASHAHIRAKGDPSSAHGQSWARFYDTLVGDVLITASVYCVNAEGNQAIVGVIVTQSNTTFVPPGSAVYRKVIDNGQGSNDPPDETGSTGLFPPLPFCPPPSSFPFIETRPVEQGNYVVTDGG
jgi:hypothetical protein